MRAILNLPLGTTDSKVAGIMVNLVGEEGFSGQVIYENIEKIMAIDGVTPHIYGKRETRPFRKMGHVTIVNENMAEARKVAEDVKNSIRAVSYTHLDVYKRQAYTMRTLYNLGKKHTWVNEELIVLLQRDCSHQTPAYKSAVKDILKRLK